jgi:hypothetical protein
MGPDRVSLQINKLSRTLDDYEYLMGSMGIVTPDHYWARAFRKKLPDGPPKPGYWLGDFFARDSNLEVLDSYVYRLTPSDKHVANGTTRRRRTPRNGTATEGRAHATSDATQEPSATPG